MMDPSWQSPLQALDWKVWSLVTNMVPGKALDDRTSSISATLVVILCVH